MSSTERMTNDVSRQITVCLASLGTNFIVGFGTSLGPTSKYPKDKDYRCGWAVLLNSTLIKTLNF